MREKLIELITDIVGFISWDNITDLADYLIENGVVIPVRCSECKHLNKHGVCEFHYDLVRFRNDYCSDGEPKEKVEE